MPSLLKFIYLCIASLIGATLGFPFGLLLIQLGLFLGLSKWLLITLSLIGVGGTASWFILPMENKLIWQRIEVRITKTENSDFNVYKFAPGTFFFIVGMLAAIKFN